MGTRQATGSQDFSSHRCNLRFAPELAATRHEVYHQQHKDVPNIAWNLIPLQKKGIEWGKDSTKFNPRHKQLKMNCICCGSKSLTFLPPDISNSKQKLTKKQLQCYSKELFQYFPYIKIYIISEEDELSNEKHLQYQEHMQQYDATQYHLDHKDENLPLPKPE